MTDVPRDSPLPPVEEKDLDAILFEDITDEKHFLRWRAFADSQPNLARALISKLDFSALDTERKKEAIDLMTYAWRALETAVRRSKDNDSDEHPAQ